MNLLIVGVFTIKNKISILVKDKHNLEGEKFKTYLNWHLNAIQSNRHH